MRGVLVGVVLLLVFSPLCVDAQTYYVDATGGSNSNDGTSPSSAWKTINKVNSMSFSPGDSILFKREETWRERLAPPSSGSSGNPITFGAYGSGGKPIINGADPVTSWTDDGSNVWYATLTSEPRQVFFDNVRGNNQTSKADVDSDKDWFWESNVLYVYSVGNPENGYTNPGIEASNSSRGQCISIHAKSYIDIKDLDLRNAHAHCLDMYNSDNINVYDNDISNSGKRGIYTSKSSYMDIYRNTFEWCGVELTTPEHGIYLGTNSSHVDVYENEVSYSWNSGIKCDSVSDVKVYRNYVHDNSQSCEYFGEIHIGSSAADLSNLEIYHNLIEIGDGYGIHTGGSHGNTKTNVSIYNNAIWDNNPGPAPKNYVLRLENIDTLNIKNNAIKTAREYVMRYNNNSNVIRDYNCYHGWTHATRMGNIDGSWVTWSDVSSVETHSIAQDPLFVDAPNTDFHLQGNSPCIDAGTNVGLTLDFEGNPVPQGSAPDIGAYEYQSPVTGNVYYVDATNGDDNNPGTSPSGAWQTWNHVRVQSFSPGDHVKFKRGESWTIIWNEYWTFTDDGTVDNYIIIEDYGSGTKPTFQLDTDMHGKTWTEETGIGSNIWSTPWSVVLHRCRLDNLDSYMAPTSEDIDGVNYIWHWNTVDDKLFVYATQNPNTEYSEIWATNTNNFMFYIQGANYVKFQNLRIQGGHYAFRFHMTTDESYIEINNCDIWYGYWPIRCEKTAGEGGSANYITINGNDIDSKENHVGQVVMEAERSTYNAMAIHNECSNWLIKNNTFTGWSHGHVGIMAKAGCSQGCHNNIIEYNTFDGTPSIYIRAFGIGGVDGKCTGNVIRYNLFKNLNVRNQLGGNNNQMYYNVIYHTTETKITDKSDVSEGLSFEILAYGVSDGNKVYNNVFYDIFNEGIRFDDETNCKNNIVKNNIFMESGQGGDEPNTCVKMHATLGTGNVVENNCFYDSDTSNVIHKNPDTAKTVSYADANYEEFSDNVWADPKFVDAANGDFHLQPGSPCINAGIDVGLTLDFEGNPVPQGDSPDTGAYEYASGIPGDLDNDGDVDIEDLIMVATHFGLIETHPDWNETANVIPDNEIDVYDLVFVASRFS